MGKEDIFKKQVRPFFEFLVEEYGFEETSPNREISSYGISVRYRRVKLFVEICFLIHESSIEVNFGRVLREGEEEEYSFHMFLGTSNPSLYYEFGGSIANTDEDVVELLKMYSEALKVDGIGIIQNDDRLFDKMRNVEKTGLGLCLPYYEQPESKKIISKFI